MAITSAQVSSRHNVVSLVAKLSRRKAEDIQDHLSLGSLGISSSIGLISLRSSMEKGATRKLPPLDLKMKISDLVNLLDGSAVPSNGESSPRSDANVRTASNPASMAPPLARTIFSGIERLNIGIDIQDIESMPIASDYRTHDFYSSTFNPSELATAMLRANIRSHLTGIFCAKEAAKKTHPVLLNLRMTEFCVDHDQNAAPLLRLVNAEAVPYAFRFRISISHTEHMATANCLTTWDD
jgi:phosphopantetheine--protein transferase-like protein